MSHFGLAILHNFIGQAVLRDLLGNNWIKLFQGLVLGHARADLLVGQWGIFPQRNAGVFNDGGDLFLVAG